MKNIDKDLFEQQIREGFTIPQLQEYWGCGRTKITEAKKKWNLVGLSPNSKKRDNGDGTKTCNKCFVKKPLSEFHSNGYSPSGEKKFKAACSKCSNEATYTEFVARILDILDEQNRLYECELCGYHANSAALTFHHHTNEKNFEVGSAKHMNRDSLAKEIAICKILCQNCHHEIHNPHCFL